MIQLYHNLHVCFSLSKHLPLFCIWGCYGYSCAELLMIICMEICWVLSHQHVFSFIDMASFPNLSYQSLLSAAMWVPVAPHPEYDLILSVKSHWKKRSGFKTKSFFLPCAEDGTQGLAYANKTISNYIPHPWVIFLKFKSHCVSLTLLSFCTQNKTQLLNIIYKVVCDFLSKLSAC